jgi:hypothetical protein
MSAETIFVLTTETLPLGFELVELFGLVETTYTQPLQKGLIRGLIERNRNELQDAIDHFRGSAPAGTNVIFGVGVSTAVANTANGAALLITHYGTATRCHIHPC